jgi:hypothetical protein
LKVPSYRAPPRRCLGACVSRRSVFCCLAVCVTCAGANGGTLSDVEKAEAWKLLEMLQNPQRQVRALLGSSFV